MTLQQHFRHLLGLVAIASCGCYALCTPLHAAQPTEEKPTVEKEAKPADAKNSAKKDDSKAKAKLQIPKVMLSGGHAALCKVSVGDAFPAITLPDLLGKDQAFASLRGERATVVIVWQEDSPMTHTLLEDVSHDVLKPFSASGVKVVGIATGQDAIAAKKTLTNTGASFTVLLDAEGTASTQLGEKKTPRVYVLGAQGKIVWFDVEYSRATRRELRQTLQVLTANGS